MIYLENEGQYHGVKHSQWYISMTNANLCKSHMIQFCSSSHSFAVALIVSAILIFQTYAIENAGHCHGGETSVFDSEYQPA